MKMSELSERSGRSVATIKYYLREGLLPAGRSTAVNQADYSEAHLDRLRLIDVLVDVGDLTLDSVRRVLAAIDDEDLSLHEALGVAHHALSPDSTAAVDAPDVQDVDAYLDDLGWHVKPDAPARGELAQALGSLRRLGWDIDASVFDRYAEAAHDLAEWELGRTPTAATRAQVVGSVVIGTVVFERAFAALRRMAQEHHSAIASGIVR